MRKIDYIIIHCSATKSNIRFDAEQCREYHVLLKQLKQRYPNAKIVGHRDFNSHKSCPCFDARSEYAGL